MHSIRTKIMSVTVAAILTSILALGGIGVLTIGVESDRSSAEKMHLISENMERSLNAYLDSIEQSVTMAIRMAHDSLDSPDVEYLGLGGDPEKVAKLDAGLARHCAEVEHAFSSIANSTSGVVTYYYCINDDYGSNEHGFFWSKLDDREFVEQPPLISSELDRNDLEHTTWYYSPLKAGSAVWIGPYKAHFLGERWTVSYVSPIYHHGFVVGVLGMDILFDTMIRQISEAKIYDTGFAFLMDRDGRLLYHPDMADPDAPILLDESLDGELLSRRSTGEMLVRYTRDGQRWQLAFTALNDYYKVAVTAPVSEITASRRQLTLLILMVAVAILAVFAVATMLLMNALTRPLLELTSASQRLMVGDFDAELDYDGDDEVGLLTRAFRHMRDYLKLYIRDLNSRAYTDAMTGVKNKGAFNACVVRLNNAIRRGEGVEFALAVFDCNNLKQINDGYGHEHGDIYIKNTSDAICRTFAHSQVFRLGGDEFAAVLERVDYQDCDRLLASFDILAAKINAAAAEPWERLDAARGLSRYRPGDASAEQVLNRADEAMYRDKRTRKAAEGAKA